MNRFLLLLAVAATPLFAQTPFVPVTDQMLENPDPIRRTG